MFQSLSTGNALHTFAIDLPIVLVIVGSLLLMAMVLRNKGHPELMVPAVMLTVLGTSSLCAFFVSRAATEALRNGPMGAEVLQHRYDLFVLALSTIAAATLLFASGLLVRSALSRTFKKTALGVISVAFGLVYVLGSVWLLIAAHEGARLADHLTTHAK